MPRYLLEIDGMDATTRLRATTLAVERFPEIDVERGYAVDAATGHRELWVCRAPGDVHVERWSVAAGFDNATIRQIEADLVVGPEALTAHRRAVRPSPDQPPQQQHQQQHQGEQP